MDGPIPDDFVLAHLDYGHNQLPNAIVATVITIVAAILAVVLRFWSRKMSRSGYGWDDWLILGALVMALAMMGNSCWWFALGAGKDMGDITPKKIRDCITVLFITEIYYFVELFLVRASALVLWRRLFTQEWVKWYCRAWRGINSVYCIVQIILVCLQCQPLSMFWTPQNPGYFAACRINEETWFLSVAICNVLIDAAIIGLPLVLCVRLKLTMLSKVLLCCIFATGFLSTIISGVRIYILKETVYGPSLQGVDALNLTWIYGPMGYWTSAEMNISIVAACLPCLRPVVSKIVPQSMVPKSLQKKTSDYGASGGNTYNSKMGLGRAAYARGSFDGEQGKAGKDNFYYELKTSGSSKSHLRGGSDDDVGMIGMAQSEGEQTWSNLSQGIHTQIRAGSQTGRSSQSGILVEEQIHVSRANR